MFTNVSTSKIKIQSLDTVHWKMRNSGYYVSSQLPVALNKFWEFYLGLLHCIASILRLIVCMLPSPKQGCFKKWHVTIVAACGSNGEAVFASMCRHLVWLDNYNFLTFQSTNHLRTIWEKDKSPGCCLKIFRWYFLVRSRMCQHQILQMIANSSEENPGNSRETLKKCCIIIISLSRAEKCSVENLRHLHSTSKSGSEDSVSKWGMF